MTMLAIDHESAAYSSSSGGVQFTVPRVDRADGATLTCSACGGRAREETLRRYDGATRVWWDVVQARCVGQLCIEKVRCAHVEVLSQTALDLPAPVAPKPLPRTNRKPPLVLNLRPRVKPEPEPEKEEEREPPMPTSTSSATAAPQYSGHAPPAPEAAATPPTTAPESKKGMPQANWEQRRQRKEYARQVATYEAGRSLWEIFDAAVAQARRYRRDFDGTDHADAPPCWCDPCMAWLLLRLHRAAIEAIDKPAPREDYARDIAALQSQICTAPDCNCVRPCAICGKPYCPEHLYTSEEDEAHGRSNRTLCEECLEEED